MTSLLSESCGPAVWGQGVPGLRSFQSLQGRVLPGFSSFWGLGSKRRKKKKEGLRQKPVCKTDDALESPRCRRESHRWTPAWLICSAGGWHPKLTFHVLNLFSNFQLFVTHGLYSLPGSSVWEFSRQEYWRALPCPPLRNLPDPRMEPTSLTSPALAGGFFTTRVTRAALISAMSEYSHIVTYTEIPKYATISSPKLSVQNALLILIFGLSFHNLDGWERGLGGKYKKDRIYIYISLTYRCYDSSSATRRTWVWASSQSWWWKGRPGMLQSTGLQRLGHDWATEWNW